MRGSVRRLVVGVAVASLTLLPGAFLSPARADTASSAEVQQALALLNTFRAGYGAPPAVDDPGMDAGAAAHAAYMSTAGVLTHDEEPSAPGYTAAGAAAGLCGDEAENDSLPDAINAWMRAPLHALIELGTYGNSTLGLGRDGSYESLTCATSLATGAVPASQPPSFPATFPAEGGSLPFYTFGGESPDPRTACTAEGFDPASVSGFGLLATFGPSHGAVSLASASLTPAGGSPVPVCVVDEANSTDTAKGILADAHSVVVFPRDALQPNTSYTWTTTADGVSVTRHFTTSTAALSVTVSPNPSFPRDLVVSVTSPTDAATGSVAVTLRAAVGADAATAPIVDSGSVRPGTSSFYTNLYVPDSLVGQINYLVTATAPGT